MLWLLHVPKQKSLIWAQLTSAWLHHASSVSFKFINKNLLIPWHYKRTLLNFNRVYYLLPNLNIQMSNHKLWYSTNKQIYQKQKNNSFYNVSFHEETDMSKLVRRMFWDICLLLRLLILKLNSCSLSALMCFFKS